MFLTACAEAPVIIKRGDVPKELLLECPIAEYPSNATWGDILEVSEKRGDAIAECNKDKQSIRTIMEAP